MKLKDYQLISPTSNKVITAAQFNDDSLWRESAYEGTKVRNKDADIKRAQLYRDTIGVIYRCIDVRAAMLSSLPWTILKGDDVFIDSETAWEEERYAWLENLTNFLYLTEASLLLSSEAFWLKEKNLLGSNTGIRWLAAPYIFPVYDERVGIAGFERRYGNNKETYSPEEMAYFWIQNPLSELLPDTPQALAAANSANVILSYENFVEKFYERGAVKATILKVDRSTPPKERARLREFWQAFMSGNKNAYTTEVVAGDVEAEVIGEGAGDSEKTEVLVSRRKDIATAMGVPYSLLFGDTSSSYTAGPTEEKNFLNYTVIPRAKMVQRVMNMSIFKEEGLYFRFNFGALPAFKEAGEVISKIFTTYTTALIPHSIAAKIAGIVMPEGISYEDLDTAVAEERERQFKEKERIVTLNSKLTPEGKPSGAKPKGVDNNVKMEEEKRFRKWLKNRNGEIDIANFESDVLDDGEKLDVFVKFLSERGSDDTAPFGLSDGVTKSLIIYGNPDGEDDSELRGLEGDATEAIWDALRGLGAHVAQQMDNLSSEQIQSQIEAIFEAAYQPLQDAILLAMLAFADVGVQRATQQVQKFIPGFNSEDAHLRTREWTTRRAVEAFGIIAATNRKRVQAILQEWNTGTLPIEWLAGEFNKFLDKTRASVIVESESIAVVTQAALFVFEATHLVRYVKFTAVKDERTCPICGKLHNQIFSLNAAPKIPLHPRCRCQYRSVVNPYDLQMFYEMVRNA